jgi:hypothetical protein
MTSFRDQGCPSLDALVAVIAHSPIDASRPDRLDGRFQIIGFEEVDIAVLQWIARERRCLDAILVM